MSNLGSRLLFIEIVTKLEKSRASIHQDGHEDESFSAEYIDYIKCGCLFRDSILFPFLLWRLDAGSELFHPSLIGLGETSQKTSFYQKVHETQVIFPPKVW